MFGGSSAGEASTHRSPDALPVSSKYRPDDRTVRSIFCCPNLYVNMATIPPRMPIRSSLAAGNASRNAISLPQFSYTEASG